MGRHVRPPSYVSKTVRISWPAPRSKTLHRNHPRSGLTNARYSPEYRDEQGSRLTPRHDRPPSVVMRSSGRGLLRWDLRANPTVGETKDDGVTCSPRSVHVWPRSVDLSSSES